MFDNIQPEIWVEIALASGKDTDEYMFNNLTQAIGRLGRWTISGTDGDIISRRLNLMETFGYSVHIRQTDPITVVAEDDDLYDIYYEGYDSYVDDHERTEYTLWKRYGNIHRNDGPAVLHNATVRYYKRGTLHRIDRPAIEWYEVTAWRWYKDGRLHRDGGPAVVDEQVKLWYKTGMLHNEYGPAYINKTGDRYWYKDGQLHRTGGPATIFAEGEMQWWKQDKRHRSDGPAVIRSSGDTVWYSKGKRHRNGGPAVTYIDGNEAYWVHGELVRVKGSYTSNGTHSIYGHTLLHT